MVAAVVLAAGAATRFGAPKQRLLLPEVLRRVRGSAEIDDIVVVLGAHEVTVDARTVRCGEWARGPGASLRCGLAALPDTAEAAVVVLADGPDLAPSAIDRVVAEWRAGRGNVLAATYGGRRSHPVLVARAAWNAVPDGGLRSVDATPVPCDDLGDPGDVDYPEDLDHPGLDAGEAAHEGKNRSVR